MKIDRMAQLDRGSGVAVAEAPEALSVLHDPACAAAIWPRVAPPAFRRWIEALPADQLPSTRTILQPDAVRDAVAQACAEAGTPAAPERDHLIEDVATLADIFAGLMGAAWLRLRLDVIGTNACRRFHVDALSARLICTYRGTGTQYGTSRQGETPSDISTAPTHSPVLLRGTLWDAGRGLLHRSPPIEGSGETRLVLVLDPIDDPTHAF